MDKRKETGAVLTTYKFFSGIIWRLIFMKAYGDVNEAYVEKNRGIFRRCFGLGKYHKRDYGQKTLKNLWDWQNQPCFSPYVPYNPSTQMLSKWRYYEINENGARDIFRTMDRAKIIFSIIMQTFNIFALNNPEIGVIESFGPLHDVYELERRKKMDLFNQLPDVVNSIQLPKHLQTILDFMASLSDEAEDRDFLHENFSDKTGSNFFLPETLNTDPFQNYFGEKVGLYFVFLKNFTLKLRWISILGILVFIADYICLYNGNLEVDSGIIESKWIFWYHYLRLIFTFIIVIWTTLFLQLWKRDQTEYAIRFGQVDFKEAETQRPDFKGTFKRNLGNNSLNKLTYSNFKKEMKVILGIGVSFFMICCSIAISLGIMFLKKKFVEEKRSALLINAVPPLLNFIAAKIFSITYEIVSRKLNDYENHRSITEFENSMINKVFLFNLFNTFNSFIIIAFLKEDTEFFGSCPDTPSNFSVTSSFGVNRSCYNELISYTTTYYIIGFALSFLEILLPAILGILFRKNYPIKRTYEWGEIDMLIEKEWDRAPYQITSEIDGVLKEYLKIALLVTAVSMFGTAFPLGFVLAYFTMSSSIKIDKFKLLNYMRRPVPKGASDIGF